MNTGNKKTKPKKTKPTKSGPTFLEAIPIAKLYKPMRLLFILLALCSCTRLPDCVNTVLSEAASPDGRLMATVFERDCGATTAKNTQVSLRPRSEIFNRERQPSFLVFEGSGIVALTWQSESNLVVHLPATLKIFRKEQEQMGVRIDYAQ